MSGFPLLLIPLAICNIIVFLMPGVAFDTRLVALPLISGALWTVSLSDALVALGLLLLMLELVRSARAGGKYITDHLLALVIFGGAAAEFLLLPPFANATFFLLTLIALVDFLSGLGLRRRPRRIVEAVAAESVHAEPVRVKPVRAEPARAEPIRPEPIRAEPAIEAVAPRSPGTPQVPASVIVTPPPPEPAALPRADRDHELVLPVRDASSQDAPMHGPSAPASEGIDVTPTAPHDRPVRVSNT